MKEIQNRDPSPRSISPTAPNRIYIFGGTGSGKSSLAETLSKGLNLPVHDLDEIQWKKGYRQTRDSAKKKKMLDELSHSNKWIIEGAYTGWIEDTVKRCDLLIWMDTPLLKSIYRVLNRQRTIQRVRLWDILRFAVKYRLNFSKSNYQETERIYNQYRGRKERVQTERERRELLANLILK